MSEPSTPEPRPARHAAEEPSFWARVPVWGWVVAAVVVLGGAVAGVLAATAGRSPEPLPTPPTVTVTAAPPSPTVEPVAREGEPTEFSQALPDTVLDLALADFAPGGGPLERSEPLEAYTLVYSDGGARSVTVHAAQFLDAEAAAKAFRRLGRDAGEPVEVTTADGQVVGEQVELADVDGQPAVLWRNTTAVLLVVADLDLARSVFTVFPL